MSTRDDALAEFRRTGFITLGIVALLAAVALLLIGAGYASQHERDPDRAATRHCGTDSGDCYRDWMNRSGFETAKGWFVGSGGALVVTIAGFHGYARRRSDVMDDRGRIRPATGRF